MRLKRDLAESILNTVRWRVSKVALRDAGTGTEYISDISSSSVISDTATNTAKLIVSALFSFSEAVTIDQVSLYPYSGTAEVVIPLSTSLTFDAGEHSVAVVIKLQYDPSL